MNREEVRMKLNEIFCDVIDDGSLLITDEMSAADIEGWDSLAQIDILTASEAVFDIKFTLDEITSLKNIGDMLDSIGGKIIK